jgi:hypothetical protein
MRRVLIPVVIVLSCVTLLAVLWILHGREISSFTDRYWTIQIESAPIQAIGYDGNGTGGTLMFNDIPLSLNELGPGISLSIGSTKDNQLALATRGKVFSFGLLRSASDDTGGRLAASPYPGDQAFLITRHSVLSWPTPFEINLMSGHSPSWKRHMYYEVRWTKSSGANLLMIWRYEQFFYPGNGWASGFMTHEGSTGLIRVEIN